MRDSDNRLQDDRAHDDEEDLTKDEIIASLRQALRELKAGEGRPALEGIAEIQRRIYGDADQEGHDAQNQNND